VNAGFSLHPVCDHNLFKCCFCFSYGFCCPFFFPFMYSLPPVDSMASKTILRYMSLEKGGAHPLATEPDIQLETELSVNLLNVRADVIEDHIVDSRSSWSTCASTTQKAMLFILWIGSWGG
jgi:hypothetical protein